jgi:hypothetical protein
MPDKVNIFLNVLDWSIGDIWIPGTQRYTVYIRNAWIIWNYWKMSHGNLLGYALKNQFIKKKLDWGHCFWSDIQGPFVVCLSVYEITTLVDLTTKTSPHFWAWKGLRQLADITNASRMLCTNSDFISRPSHQIHLRQPPSASLVWGRTHSSGNGSKVRKREWNGTDFRSSIRCRTLIKDVHHLHLVQYLSSHLKKISDSLYTKWSETEKRRSPKIGLTCTVAVSIVVIATKIKRLESIYVKK